MSRILEMFHFWEKKPYGMPAQTKIAFKHIPQYSQPNPDQHWYKKHNVYTLLGDGELSEGSVWEALLSANKYGLDNLIVIVDRNKLQITGKTEDINPIEPLKDKFNAFGLSTKEVDGNSVQELIEILSSTPFEKNKVSLIIANTVKGKGVSFMENEVVWHHKVPSEEQYKLAQKELEKLKIKIENDWKSEFRNICRNSFRVSKKR